MKMRMRGWIVIAGCLLCACSEGTRTPFVRSVVLTTPVVLERTSVRNYSGVVREAHEISLGFKTAGQIECIRVGEGDYVHRGQLLAELDDDDYRLGVEALQIQYDQLADEVERTERLFRQKSVSANDYEKAVAGLKQLGVQLQVNRNKLGYTKLYAPVDGYVESVHFSPAEMVDAGTSVFTLLDVSSMEVEADIPAGEYRQRDRFTGYVCRPSGLGEDYRMRLLSLAPRADGNQLYRLRLAFAERPGRGLTAGMNAEVGISVADTAAARGVAVSLCAVFRDGGRPCVWELRPDSTVVKRVVTLGNTDSEGRAVVVEGLTGGERIVRAGVNVLQEGEKVRVIDAPGESNVGGML